VLLGMSGGQPAANPIFIGYGADELLVAAGIGAYIVGVTWFARSEAGVSRRPVLVAAMLVMALGTTILGTSAFYTPLQFNHQIYGRQLYWLLLAMLLFTVLRRCGSAALDPAPRKVQAAVKHAILSLIWLD